MNEIYSINDDDDEITRWVDEEIEREYRRAYPHEGKSLTNKQFLQVAENFSER